MATIHPLTGFYKWLQSNAHVLLLLSWVAGLAYAYIPIEHTATRSFEYDGATYYECAYQLRLSKEKRHLFVACNFVLTFAAPALVLTFVYCVIVRKFIAIQQRQRHFAQSQIKTAPTAQPLNGTLLGSSNKQV